MEKGKKLFVGTLLALCIVLLALCVVLAVGWDKAANTAAALPEVRNDGTAIQWKYADERVWRDIVTLAELRGADGASGKDGTDGKNGADGADGKDGINGKDGIDGKKIEVRRDASCIQWRYAGEEWSDLVALADITGPAGKNGADGVDAKTPEFRVSENTLQWRYIGDDIWLNLYDLTSLRGADGIDGKDGKNGKDGKDGIDGQDGADGKNGDTPFIGENGNWWISERDTGVKAAGSQGEKGEKGDKGDKGEAGQNGGCSGWFYGELWTKGDLYKQDGTSRPVGVKVYEEASSGGLVSIYADKITLKSGHSYSVGISGSIELQSHESSGNYSVQMMDNYDDDFCREATRIKRDGVKVPNSKDQHHFSFNRIYVASEKDIPLRFTIEQSSYKTSLLGFNGTITITALD